MAKRPKTARPIGHEHTPGPWRADIFEPGRAAIIRRTDSIAGMRNSGDYLAKEFDANARLIAAAPELFSSLVTLVCVIGDHPGFVNCLAPRELKAFGRAHAAIVKATEK